MLPLLPDEAFYWQCAQRPALAYVDLPFMTAMLVRAGTTALGDTELGVRLLFLVCGALVPAAVVLLARPLVGDRDAWLAGAATLCIPSLSLLGIFALPDGPFLLLNVLVLAAFERATRTGRLRAWLAAGVCGALGFATHNRFALVPAAALLYLVSTRVGRAQWRKPGVWLAGGVTLLGLLPAILFNAGLDWAPLHYQLVGRHARRFAASSLGVYLFEQAVSAGPLLYVALLAVLLALLRRAAHDDRAALFAIAAAVPLVVFFVASPWADRLHVRLHWPLPGYLPLLVFLPGLLRDVAGGGRAWPRRGLVALVPGVSALWLAVILTNLLSGWPELPERNHRRAFVGFDEGATRARALLPKVAGSLGGHPLVVGDNYIIAAHLEFRLHGSADVFVLDHRRNHQQGRALQYVIWGRGEAGLRSRPGPDALVVVERSAVGGRRARAWLAHVRGFFSRLEPIDELTVRAPWGTRRFQYFVGRGGGGLESGRRTAGPPRGAVDRAPDRATARAVRA